MNWSHLVANLADHLTIGPSDIASYIGLPVETLYSIAASTDRHYEPTELRKTPKGKVRQLDVPKPYLKRILKKLHRLVQAAGWYSPAAHGGVRKMSSFTSAGCHLGQHVCITRDITNCYPNVKTKLFREALRQLGFRSDVSRLLSGLMTCRDRIPQGSPTSGDALNLYLWSMDTLMISHCGDQVSYTRMADDHVLSGSDQVAVDAADIYLEKLLQERGLAINEEKRRKYGPGLSSKVQVVHSIAVNHPTKTRIPRDRSENWRLFAERYVGAAKCVSADTLCLVAKKRRTLEGYIHYCAQAGISPSKHLAILASHGDKYVLKKLRDCNVTRSSNSKWWREKARSVELTKRWKKNLQLKEPAQHTTPQESTQRKDANFVLT